MTASETTVRPPRLGWVFAVVATGLFVQSVDTTIVATAFDAMQTGLSTSIAWVSWSLTAYAFGMVIALPISAQVVRRLGPRRTFLWSILAFGVISGLCGAAPNIAVLIGLRVVQAFAGAGLTPSATAVIVDHFGKSRDRAIGFFGSLFQAGTIAGPIFGGLFVQFSSWRWIFFVNVPICLVLYVAGNVLIPRRAPSVSQRGAVTFDYRGMALLSGGVALGMLGITLMGEAGSGAMRFVAAIALALAGAALLFFYTHVKRERNPFIEPKLITGRGFGAVNIVNIVYGGANVGLLSLLPFYAQTRYGTSPVASGGVLTASAIGGLAFGFVGVLALRRSGYRWPLWINAVVSGVSWILLAVAPPAAVPPFLWMAIFAGVVGMGRGGSDPAARNAGIQLMPAEAASIAALRTMGRRIGTIVVVSVVTAVAAAAPDAAVAQAGAFVVFGVVLLVCTVAIARVPEHKGSW